MKIVVHWLQHGQFVEEVLEMDGAPMVGDYIVKSAAYFLVTQRWWRIPVLNVALMEVEELPTDGIFKSEAPTSLDTKRRE